MYCEGCLEKNAGFEKAAIFVLFFFFFWLAACVSLFSLSVICYHARTNLIWAEVPGMAEIRDKLSTSVFIRDVFDYYNLL